MRPISVRSLHPRLRLDWRTVIRTLRVLEDNLAGLGTARSTLGNRRELSIVFLTEDALARLHADFLADPTPTDVITFAGDPALGTAGEICVSADAAAHFAADRRRDFSEELTLYLAHGWLHLAGHDDLAPAAKRAMRRAESRALRALRLAGAMPRFSLQAGLRRRA